MLSYLKQTEKNTCGVIAAMNLDIWRGKKVSIADFPAYKEALNFKRTTYRRFFSKWIGSRPTRLNWPKLKQHLLTGGSAVILSRRGKTGHFYFVDGVYENWARCVNFYPGFPTTWIHWRWLCKLLTRSSVWRIYES
jgi:hypothetical protein